VPDHVPAVSLEHTHALVLPQPAFYLTLVAGLVTSVAVIAASLPIFGRITATENARFE
jgi:hypothetical protein